MPYISNTPWHLMTIKNAKDWKIMCAVQRYCGKLLSSYTLLGSFDLYKINAEYLIEEYFRQNNWARGGLNFAVINCGNFV